MSKHAEESLPLWVSVSLTDSGLADNPEVMSSTRRMVFSASRIGTWIACNRKAAWQYFAGYVPPSTPASDRGGRVHKVLEMHVPALIIGAACEIDRTHEDGAIAAEIVPHIPAEVLGPDTSFEAKFTIQGRHTWSGYVDLRRPGIVVDYKTTSDFKWMKTEADLELDPQAIIYARSEFIVQPALDTVWQRWIYSRTRGAPQARHVDVTPTRDVNARLFDVLETFADEMQAAADACPPESDPVALHKYVLHSVRGNLDRCNDYGGCPHRTRCGVFFDDPTRPKDIHHMNVLERLQAMTALNGGAANEAPTPPPTATPALSPATPPSSLFARLAAEAGTAEPRKETQGAGHPVPGGTRTLAPGTSPLPQADIDAAVKAASGINPPKRTRGRPAKDTIPAPALARSDADGPAKPLTELVQEAHVDRDGFVTPVAAVSLVVPAAQQIPITSAVAVPTVTPATPHCANGGNTITHHIEKLYIGCVPVARTYNTLDELLIEVRDMIGPAVYFGGYGYKTNGMVSEAIPKIVTKRLWGTIVVTDPHAPEAALVLPYLRSQAALVVQALR